MKRVALITSLVGLLAVGSAYATVIDVTVDAKNNSTSGGSGAFALNLAVGQAYSVSVDVNDLWNAGAIPRWSNANGLIGNLFYVSGTDAQVPVYSINTKIGQSFGTWSQGGLTAPYGSLVGQIDNSNYFLIGSSYNGVASQAGVLKLSYFDSNNSDNSGSIRAHVATVPEPETHTMLLAGLGLLGFMTRRRKNPVS